MMHYGNPEHLSQSILGQIRYGDAELICASPVTFKLQYLDLLKDQGLSIQVLAEVDGEEQQVLRFYCLDQLPHYFYGPDERGFRISIDTTTEGDPLDWSLWLLRNRLPELVARAGFEEVASAIDMSALESALAGMEKAARRMAQEQRSTVVHNRGDVMVEAGPVRFGVEDREPGIAIHVLGDVDGEEKEMLAFDCFDKDPHYHYGPRAKNERLYLDPAAVPDPLRWTIDLFKGGKLGPMLERAGYADHAARLNPATLAQRVAEVESAAFEMRAARGA